MSSFSYQNHKLNVRQVQVVPSQYLGKEMFHLVGAMVANAKVDEDGNYIDGGNLEIKAFEILAENLVSYDNSLLVGAGFGYEAKKEGGMLGNKYTFAYGDKDYEKITYATIGQGLVTATRIGDLNQDVNNPESQIEGDKTDTIRGTWQSVDLSKAWDLLSTTTPKTLVDRTINNFKDNIDTLKGYVNKLTGHEPKPLNVWDILDIKPQNQDEEIQKNGYAITAEEIDNTIGDPGYDGENLVEDIEEAEAKKELKVLEDLISELDNKGVTKAQNPSSWFDQFINNAQASDGTNPEDNSLTAVKNYIDEHSDRLGGYLVNLIKEGIKNNPKFTSILKTVGTESLDTLNKIEGVMMSPIKGWLRIAIGDEHTDKLGKKVEDYTNEVLGYIGNKLENLSTNQKALAAAVLLVGAITLKGKAQAEKVYDKYLKKLFNPEEAAKTNYLSSKQVHYEFKTLDKPTKLQLNKALQTAQAIEIKEIFAKLGFDIPTEALKKVPDLNWKPELSRTLGVKWNEYANKHRAVSNEIRISKGSKDAEYASRQQDYVKIISNGKVIGRDGIEISSKEHAYPSEHPDAHIPLSEWIKWKGWNKP